MKNTPAARRQNWMSRNFLTLLTVAIIAGYAAYVQWIWGWGQIVALWGEVGIGPMLLALVLLVSSYFLRAWRIYDYFPRQTAGQFRALFRLTQIHNLLNVMLPFRAGETSFPILMKTEFGVPLASGTSSLFVMRLFDLHALLAAAATGLAMKAGTPLGWVMWFGFLILPVLAFTIRGKVFRLARACLPARAAGILDGLEAGLPAGGRAFSRAWLATIVNWFVKIAVLAWVLALMGGYSLATGFGGALGGELSSVLPVHAPAGVGTYPAGIVGGAIAFGAAVDRAAIAALGQVAVNVHLLIVISSLAGAVLALLLSRKNAN